MLDRNETIKRIRAALRRRSGKAWSVTGGRGTAWGWIRIDVPPKRRTWHFRNTCRVEGSGSPIMEEYEDASWEGSMSPAERAELTALLGLTRSVHHQGESIPAGGDYYQEYVDRAEGRAPTAYGAPYWD